MCHSLKGNLLPPDKHPNVPENAQWLAGQGEGTWFVITQENERKSTAFRVRRISPQGNLDCDRVFTLQKGVFNIQEAWQIAYPSHCAKVTLIQHNQTVELIYEENSVV